MIDMRKMDRAPAGVILQGSIGPMSRRINLWCAHYGQTLIVDWVRTRRDAISASWTWYNSTTDARRSAMLAADDLEARKNMLHRAAVIMRASGGALLADAVDVFAVDLT